MSNIAHKRYIATLVVIGLLIGNLIVGPSPVVAQQECPQDMGTRVPVVLVHGYGGSPDDWAKNEPSSTENSVLSIQKAWLPDTHFDFRSVATSWVTHPEIGPKLTNHIACLAEASRKAGGPGKVIAVGYSLGGLAVQYAANQTVNGRSVADDLAGVVTIGTPHLGVEPLGVLGAVNDFGKDVCEIGRLRAQLVASDSTAATMSCEGLISLLDGATNAMRPDSEQLKQLPPFPSQVPVRSIAGNVVGVETILNWAMPVNGTDNLVSVKSAHAYATNKGVGDGSNIVTCQANAVLAHISHVSCSHGELLRDKEVQAHVVDAVGKYIKSLEPKRKPAPPPCPSASAISTQLQKEDAATPESIESYPVRLGPVCEGDWASVVVDGFGGDLLVLMHFRGDWQKEMAGHFIPEATCATLPPKVRGLFDQLQGCM